MINLKFGNVIKKLLIMWMTFFVVLTLGGCGQHLQNTSVNKVIAPPASQSKSSKESSASYTQEQKWDGYKKDHQLGVKVPIHPDLPEETSTNSE